MFCREMIDRMIHLLFLRERRRKRYLRPLKIVFLLFTTAHYYFMLVCLCISALQPPTWHHLHVEFCESFCISPNIMISLPIILVYHLVASTWDRLQYFTHPSPRHRSDLPSIASPLLPWVPLSPKHISVHAILLSLISFQP